MTARPEIVWSEAALALFRLDRPTAVSAGAGSGKTTALVELCVRLLSGEATGTPCDPGAVVAITFTEKAAEELVLRLRGAVAARAQAAARAAPPLFGPAPAQRGEGGGAGAQAWLERLHGLDRMAAGTIHAFCGRLLREHAPEAGLDPEFTVVDEERAGAWLAGACRAAVVAALDEGRPATRVLTAGLGAAARGGLAALVAELCRARSTRGDAGVPAVAPADPDALRAAWERLGEAAGDLLRLARESRSAAAAALLDQVARAWVGVETWSRREAAVQVQVQVQVGGGGGGGGGGEGEGGGGGGGEGGGGGGGEGAGGDPGPEVIARLRALDDATRGPRLGKADAILREARDALRERALEVGRLEAERLAGPQKEELARLVADAEARYAARKREARAADFDDLLVRARDLLAREGALRAELRGRLEALLVDEYQDVNRLQQELFDLLTARGEDAREPAPILVAVGDLKQSIYRFRGADVSVFARLVRRFGTPADAAGGRVLRLSENHRSVPAVLDLVNEVSAHALAPPAGAPPRDDELRFEASDRLVPRRPEAARPACELLCDAEGAGGDAADRRRLEADAIVRRIQALLSGAAGVAVREKGEGGVERPRRPRPGDVAILFRRLTQIGPYERALRAAGIPYRLARGGGFYQAPEVRDLGELCASLFDPSDAVAWAALLRSPMCAVSDGTLVLLGQGGLGRLGRRRLAELRREVEAHAGAGAVPEAEWARIARLLTAWRALWELRDRVPLADLLARAVEALDLDAALLAAPGGERRAVNLAKAVALAARFEADGGRPHELAAHLRALAARPPREPEADLEAEDAVAMVSVHQAKGLEWPVAFVPDLGAAPRHDHRQAVLDGDGRLCAALYDGAREEHVETAALRAAREAERRSASAESRRLLYVALTRARDHLVLSGEAPRGGDTWRALVDLAVAARPDLVRRVPYAEAGTLAAGPALPEGGRTGAPPPSLPAPRLARPAPVAALRVAVTDLAEFARCPRRHRFSRLLGLPEPRGVPRGPVGDDPARATARGTLAHALVAEADLAAPPLERRAQLQAAASRRGYDPASPAVRRILAEVSRFADSEAGRELARAGREGRLSREVPFLLRLDGDGVPAAYLVGALDALVVGRRGEGVLVVDYKYASPRPEAVERYRLQLLAYGLAAARAHPGARVRARLQFLRGDFRALDVTPGAHELAVFAREAPRLAWAAHAGAEGERPPAAIGRDEARCRAEGCGWVSRCYRRAPSGQPER
jgi:ATP-dependent exoDNAse (exonuclease V) beta subunit